MRLMQLKEAGKISGGLETYDVGVQFLGLSAYELSIIHQTAVEATDAQRDEANAGLAEAQAAWDAEFASMSANIDLLAYLATLIDPGAPVISIPVRTPPTPPGPEPTPPQEPWFIASGTGSGSGSGSGSSEDMIGELIDYLYAYEDYEYAHEEWEMEWSQYQSDLESYYQTLEEDAAFEEYFYDEIYNPWFEDTFYYYQGLFTSEIIDEIGPRPTSNFNWQAAFAENYDVAYEEYLDYLRENPLPAVFSIFELDAALFWDPDLNDGAGGYAGNLDVLIPSAIDAARDLWGSGYADIYVTYPDDFPLEYAG